MRVMGEIIIEQIDIINKANFSALLLFVSLKRSSVEKHNNKVVLAHLLDNNMTQTFTDRSSTKCWFNFLYISPSNFYKKLWATNFNISIRQKQHFMLLLLS